MNKIFIISTRLMLSPHCFLQVPPCRREAVGLDTPFVNYLLGDSGMPGFLMDVYEDDGDRFPDPLRKKVRSIVPDGHLFDDMDILNRWLREEGGAALVDEAFHDFWRTYGLGELLPVVKGLSWNDCLRIDGESCTVIAVQHLPSGPGTVRTHKDSVAWVQALLDTFAPAGQDVCLVLHDRDLSGFEDIPYYLLSSHEVCAYTQRPNVRIIVFTHSENPVTRCLSERDPDAFFSAVAALPELLETAQRNKNLTDSL